jgi:hypothetical protein
MTTDKAALERLLGQVFDDCREGLRDDLSPAEYERRRHEFVFHMLDWPKDFQFLSGLFANPEGRDIQDVSTSLIAFLYHVIPHLNAAGRLLLDEVPDPFAEARPPSEKVS